MLRNGTEAPDFTLLDADGIPRSLAELHEGRPFLLCFYRFAGCPTARRDIAVYAELHSRFEEIGAGMAGISADPVEHSRRMRSALGVPFPLLSDPGLCVSSQYGVYRSDDVGEGPDPHGEPAVVILDVDRKVAYSQIQTGPKGTASPSEMALVLLYMAGNGGRY